LWYKEINPSFWVNQMRPASKWIAYLCLLLIFGSAIAFAAHQHLDGTESATCTVCVAAHSTSPTVPALLLRTTFFAICTVVTVQIAAAKQRLIAFALTVRPPPEV
jgi:predicted Na+-dependent transporter